LSARDFASLNAEDSFALQSVKVLGEAAAIRVEVVAFDDEGEQGIELVVGVEGSEEVAGISLGEDREEVTDRGREERRELLFREEFWTRSVSLMLEAGRDSQYQRGKVCGHPRHSADST
jgi:hypothetical protein